MGFQLSEDYDDLASFVHQSRHFTYNLYQFNVLCQEQLIMCLTNSPKKTTLQYKDNMINGEKSKGFVVSEFFFSLKIVSSLRILLCGMLQRIAVHYTFPTMTGD